MRIFHPKFYVDIFHEMGAFSVYMLTQNTPTLALSLSLKHTHTHSLSLTHKRIFGQFSEIRTLFTHKNKIHKKKLNTKSIRTLVTHTPAHIHTYPTHKSVPHTHTQTHTHT